MYNQLYKFDVKAELGDYNLPFGEEEDKKKIRLADRNPNMSKMSSLYDNDDKSESDHHSNLPENESELHVKTNYTTIVKGLFNEQV